MRGSLGLLCCLLFLLIGDGLVVHTGDVDLHCRYLVLKEVKVFLGGAEAGLSVAQVSLQERQCLIVGVLDHDVGSEPETHAAGVVGDRCLGPDVIADKEIGLENLLLFFLLGVLVL